MEKTKKKFIISNEYRFDKTKHVEKVEGTSMTVPSETLTIRQIMERFSRGLPVSGSVQEPQYDSLATLDSDDIEKLSHMDLFEREEYQRALIKRVQNQKAKLDEEKKKNDERLKAEKEELELLKAEIKKRTSAPKDGAEGKTEGKPSSTPTRPAGSKET